MKPSNPRSKGRRGVSKATLFAGVLVVVGAVLAGSVDMAFLVVFGAGVFGPGALRELGVLNDQDEFQREASRVAGYRAYLAAGLFVSVWLAAAQRGSTNLDSEMALSVVMVLILLILFLPVMACGLVLLGSGTEGAGEEAGFGRIQWRF